MEDKLILARIFSVFKQDVGIVLMSRDRDANFDVLLYRENIMFSWKSFVFFLCYEMAQYIIHNYDQSKDRL
jgi:hypothetical protein